MPDPASTSKRVKRTGWPLPAGLAFLAALLWLSMALVDKADALKTQDWQRDELTYLPSGKYLKPMALGFDEAAASLLWVKGVIYFGEAYLTQGDYRWMGHILDITTTLNPHFKEAYEFATYLAKDKGEITTSLKLLERGMRHYPREWKWRVLAALARQRLDSNLLAAAEYLKPLAGDTGVPQYVQGLAARFMDKGGQSEMALAYLADQYLRAPSAMQREILANRIALVNLPDTAGMQTERKNALVGDRQGQVQALLKQVAAHPQDASRTLLQLRKVVLGHP